MTLPQTYLDAEAVARPGLDHPDHTALAQLLEMTVEACGRLVATTTDIENLALREALPRAARILDPNTYVPISMFNWSKIADGIRSTCPIMRRFASAQYFIGTVGDRANGTVGAPAEPFDFTTLQPDGDVVFVPYVDGAPENVTLASVAAEEAKDEAAVVGTIEPATPALPPFPHAADAVHPLDASTPDTVITKTTVDGFKVEAPANAGTGAGPHVSDGNPIVAGDVLAHLPVGAQLIIGNEGPTKVVAVLPETGFRAQVSAVGEDIHTAIAKLWAWLVKEGHAVVAAVEKL